MAKQSRSKILAGILAVVMIVSLLPVNLFTTVFAARINSYTVRLTDGTDVLDLDDVAITLTNKNDPAVTETQNTVDGVATFEDFVEEETTYTLTIAPVVGYEDVVASDYDVAVDEVNHDVTLTAIEKVTVSGKVTNENDEAYEGATVGVSGYFTTQTVTDENGDYSIDAYKGKEITITIQAKSTDKQYADGTIKATYNTATADVNHKFAVKTYNITTNSATVQNGSIDAGASDVPYGEQRDFNVTANEGYRIDKVTVNGIEENGAAGQKTYTVSIPDIKANYDVIASFYRMTYKVTFTIGENGEVTYGDGASDKVAGGSIAVEKQFNESTDSLNPTKVTITAIPNTSYRVSKVVINSASPLLFTENDKEYSTELTMTEDQTFEVEFSINEYKLSVDAGENGSAIWGTDGTEVTVKHGEDATLNITANPGYAIGTVTVNGSNVDFAEGEDGTCAIEFADVAENTDVIVTFEEIPEVNPADKLVNDYYKITFSSEQVKEAYFDGSTYIVVLPNDATATIEAVSPYTHLKHNPTGSYGGFKKSITIDKTTLINNIYVKNGKYASNFVNAPVDVKIIIDKKAPVVADITEPEWTNNDTVTINGTVTDENVTGKESSGLNYIVWSKDATLSVDNVLNATENKVSIVDGAYTFDSVAGEQNATYYVYAVDYAGNVSAANTVKIKIDKKNPTVTTFTFSTDKNSMVENLINFATFGTICKETMYVTITVSDEAISSGIKEISLYYDGQLLETLAAISGSATFELKEDKFHDGEEIYAIATDIAGNRSVITKPTDANVTTQANSDVVQISTDKPTAIIDNVDGIVVGENHWYNGNVEFTVTAKDEVSGLKSIVIKMNGQVLTTDLSETPVDLTQDFSTGTKITEKIFKVNTSQNVLDGKNTIEVVVTSAAGVESIVYSKDVYIDTTKADIVGYEITRINDTPLDKVINFLSFGVFCNEQVKITVAAADTNASSGVKNITLYLGGKAYDTLPVDSNNQATFSVTQSALNAGDVYSKDISAVATDNVDNTTATPVIPTTVNSDIKNSTLMLEKVDPTVDVQFAPAASGKNDATKDANDWYNDDVEFTVTAGDVDSGLRNVVVTINDKELVNESYYNDEAADIETHEEVYKVNTSDAVRAEDGSYTIKVVITDNAGNVNNTYTKTIYKDIDAPYITGFDFVPENYVEGDEEIAKNAVVSTDYGFYFKTDTDVIVSANDIAPTAGIKSITYYTVDFTNSTTGVKNAEQTALVNAENKITITIPANFKGQIYAKATDNVDNVTAAFANPNSAIVEDADKHEAEEHIAFTKADTAYTANDGTELYANDVDVTLTVTDTYSGIRDIEWSVVAPYDTDKNQSGKVTFNNDKSITADSDTDWTQSKTEVNLVTEMQKTIKVSNDSNNIIVKVKMTDRAGNTSEKQIEFSIDKFDPTIEIAYSNEEVHDEQYTDFFSTKRTATITVTERNFRASDIVFAITNTDKTIPTVDLKADATWITTANAEDPNKTTHIAVVKYTVDGDYTFDISYKDNAENSANTIEQHKFTIDMTKPVVSVAYNNNSALNGNYYKADRIATITIKEHNFDAARVNVVGVATDNGVASTFPTESKWTSIGDDTYTATIAYTADSKYTFDIEFRDKANNSIADYTPEEFYVDKTAPNLEISGVADKSANNGDVIPVITYSDTNFDKDAVTITLSGINNGVVNYSGSYADVANGQKYTYANFEKVQKVDDIYTLTAKLTDKAGNETEMTITFSANRFGSVYDLSKVEEIISKYLQTEQDIIFTETNVDALEREGILVKLTKNGTPQNLVEGTDYTVELTGGNGQWSVYTYTINKSLFTGDGRYNISVYSKDAAGNVNENIDESKEAEISFGIDKTAPVIVPIDLESGKQYPVELKKVSVEIKDNLVLESVKIYLNGKEIEYTVDGETYSFDIPESNSVHDVKIVAVDAAGNESHVEIEDILVSTNIFVRWYNNTPLFIGSIIGVVLLGLGITTFILFGKKKKNEENN